MCFVLRRSSFFLTSFLFVDTMELLKMARLSDEEKEAFRKASEAVMPVLEKLEREKAKLEERIARLRAVLDAGGNTPSPTKPSMNGFRPIERVQRGEVSQRVREILVDGGEYTEPELRTKLLERHRKWYSRAAVYSALLRGKEGGEYENIGGKWRKPSLLKETA